jgi:hypothetical protein
MLFGAPISADFRYGIRESFHATELWDHTHITAQNNEDGGDARAMRGAVVV